MNNYERKFEQFPDGNTEEIAFFGGKKYIVNNLSNGTCSGCVFERCSCFNSKSIQKKAFFNGTAPHCGCRPIIFLAIPYKKTTVNDIIDSSFIGKILVKASGTMYNKEICKISMSTSSDSCKPQNVLLLTLSDGVEIELLGTENIILK